MKLSEFSTDRALDALCELTPYVNNIVTDEDLMSELKTAIKADKATTRAEQLALGISKINKIVPIVFKKRKQDVCGILGVLNEKQPEEIAAQNFLVTAAQVRELVKDRELIDFFKSCAGTEGGE